MLIKSQNETLSQLKFVFGQRQGHGQGQVYSFAIALSPRRLEELYHVVDSI
jgi:hypothetical protein